MMTLSPSLRRRCLVGAACLAYAILFWRRLVVQGLFRLNPDTLIYYYPWWSVGKRLLSGGFLLWDPYRNMGQPFLASPQNQALYPPRLLSLATGFIGYERVSVLLHSLGAAAAAYALARRRNTERSAALFAALALGFNGFFLARLGYEAQFTSMAWIPVVVCCAASRRSWAFGLALALQWTAGYPTFVILSVAGAALFLFVDAPPRDAVRVLVIGGLAGAGLAAVQWVPFLALLRSSIRPVVVGADFATENSVPPSLLWRQLLLPAPWSQWAAAGAHAFTLFYLGPLFAVLFVIGILRGGRRDRALGAAAVLCLLLSLGGHLPFYGRLPILRVFRYPANWLALFQLFGVFVATAGLRALPSARWRAAIVVLFAADLLHYASRSFFLWGDAAAWTSTPVRIAGLDRDFSDERLFHPPYIHKTSVAYGAGDSLDAWTFAKGILIPSYGAALGYREAVSLDVLESRAHKAFVDRMMAEGPDSRLFDEARVAATVGITPSGLKRGDVRWGDIVVIANPDPLPRAYFGEGSGRASVVSDRPGHVHVAAEGPGRLVVSEAAAPGWRVRIDGRRTSLQPWDDFFLGVALPAGAHDVRFDYRPWTVIAGAGVSIGTALAFLGVGALRRRRGGGSTA